MGSSLGLKIKSIEKNETIKSITFMANKYHIVPYVYFITKINNFVEEFRKNQIVKNFTVYNVITQKEYTISIEYMQSDAFVKGIEYERKELPQLNQFLLISNVAKNSISDKCGIIKDEMILLGNKSNYFTAINDVVMDVQNKKEEFVFYNFKKDYMIVINFTEKRIEMKCEGEGLGFECQEISRINFITYYYNFEEEEKGLNTIDELLKDKNGDGIVHGLSDEEKDDKKIKEQNNKEEIIQLNKEIEQKEEDIKDTNNINEADSKTTVEQQKVIPEPVVSLEEKITNTNNVFQENKEEHQEEKKEKLIDNKNNDNVNPIIEEVQQSINNNNEQTSNQASNLLSLNEMIISEPPNQEEKPLQTLEDSLKDKAKIEEIIDTRKKPDTSSTDTPNKKEEQTQPINSSSPIKEEQKEQSIPDSNVLIPKEKYKKELPVYSKIDLNYNFIRKKDNTSTNNLISNDANQFHFIKSSPLSTNLSVIDIFNSINIIQVKNN